MKSIHDRMPVIIDKKYEKEWLDDELPVEGAIELLDPYPSNKMQKYEIGTLVNNPRHNSKDIIKPYK